MSPPGLKQKRTLRLHHIGSDLLDREERLLLTKATDRPTRICSKAVRSLCL
ncbi:hypothetical protein I79_013926 [Cricetulus griseus]|uniref:Uncharacterized protein n=1 Tax=Cricetulus griseus TaxID=10029 RepID=G3HST2_CRIGR|nr:hypothetical protein I79_013926 [Cricetulus griseus]